MMDKGCEAKVSRSAADEIRELTAEIAGQTSDTVDRFFAKFDKVMRSEGPKNPKKDGLAAREYPIYFQDLKDNLLEIQRNVDRIYEGVNRSEL